MRQKRNFVPFAEPATIKFTEWSGDNDTLTSSGY